MELTYGDLKREVGRSTNSGRVESEWSSEAASDIADGIKSGLRSFYYNESQHVWEFLSVTQEMTFSSGIHVANLPSDFLKMLSDITSDHPLVMVDNVRFRSASSAGESGEPEYYNIRKNSTGYEIAVHPVPSKDVTIYFRYMKEPVAPTADDQTFEGGSLHSETILAACNLACDIRISQENPNPLLKERFDTLLANSIANDKSFLGAVE